MKYFRAYQQVLDIADNEFSLRGVIDWMDAHGVKRAGERADYVFYALGLEKARKRYFANKGAPA